MMLNKEMSEKGTDKMRVITSVNYLMNYIIRDKTIFLCKKNRNITSCVTGEVVGQLSG